MSKAGKEDKAKGANAADVDVYFNQIKQVIKQYRCAARRRSVAAAARGRAR